MENYLLSTFFISFRTTSEALLIACGLMCVMVLLDRGDQKNLYGVIRLIIFELTIIGEM